ncbi:uncharacterized protein J3D65DRAFT_350404 [Phyllosticta citribraziliensis]|uniref:Uncharacterized protein n=1 Tax=Phyllosticta citribraziliensis TaxID=989973 RepID=A0ABR1LUE6_9PEZI
MLPLGRRSSESCSRRNVCKGHSMISDICGVVGTSWETRNHFRADRNQRGRGGKRKKKRIDRACRPLSYFPGPQVGWPPESTYQRSACSCSTARAAPLLRPSTRSFSSLAKAILLHKVCQSSCAATYLHPPLCSPSVGIPVASYVCSNNVVLPPSLCSCSVLSVFPIPAYLPTGHSRGIQHDFRHGKKNKITSRPMYINLKSSQVDIHIKPIHPFINFLSALLRPPLPHKSSSTATHALFSLETSASAIEERSWKK